MYNTHLCKWCINILENVYICATYYGLSNHLPAKTKTLLYRYGSFHLRLKHLYNTTMIIYIFIISIVDICYYYHVNRLFCFWAYLSHSWLILCCTMQNTMTIQEWGCGYRAKCFQPNSCTTVTCVAEFKLHNYSYLCRNRTDTPQLLHISCQ